MQQITITAVIEKSAAIAAGRDQYGEIVITVAPSTLTERQRAALAAIGEKTIRSDYTIGYTPCRYPPVPVDLADNPAILASYLDAVQDRLDAAAAAEKSKRDELLAKSREALITALNQPVEAWLSNTFNPGRDWSIRVPGDFYERITPPDLCDALASRRAEAEAEATRRNTEGAERYAAAQQAKKLAAAAAEAEAAAKLQRQQAQLTAWVAQYGTPSQQARQARGMLADEEVINAIRDQLFAPLADYPRYQRITSEEVFAECGGDSDYDEIKYAVDNLTTLTEAEFTRLTEIEALMPGATVQFREHVGYLAVRDDDDDPEVRRLSILVSAQCGDYNFSREYATE